MGTEHHNTELKKESSRKAKPSILAFVRELMLAGKNNADVLAEVRKNFPQKDAALQTINVYRTRFRAEGEPILGERELQKENKHSEKSPKTKKSKRKVSRNTVSELVRRAVEMGLSREQVLEFVRAEYKQGDFKENTVHTLRSLWRKKLNIKSAPKAAKKEAKIELIEMAKQAEAPAQESAKTKTIAQKMTHAPKKEAILLTPMRTVAIGCDHAGVELKDFLKKVMEEQGITVLDFGTHGSASVDYPDYANAVAQSLAWGEATRGVVICGSGVGISIAANRHRHVRAALCTSGLMAKLARQHNDANVLALGARLIGMETAKDCLLQFLNTQFEGGRHAARVEKMS